MDKRSVATVRVKHALAGLSVLAVTSDGDFYVLVEELTNTPDIVIDQTVRRYRADGTLVELARVPVAQRFTDVSHGVAVSPYGQVYALITRRSRADVVQLEFSPSLPEILPAQPAMALSHARSVRRVRRCQRSRAAIRAAANAYVNNQTFLTAARLNRKCANRQKPTYLDRGVRRYPSVPYDWDGFDTVLSYNNYMKGTNPKYTAGDRKVDEAATSSTDCSRGVDCSGFVSRCWGLPTKISTKTLFGVSYKINYNDLQTSDILIKWGNTWSSSTGGGATRTAASGTASTSGRPRSIRTSTA